MMRAIIVVALLGLTLSGCGRGSSHETSTAPGSGVPSDNAPQGSGQGGAKSGGSSAAAQNNQQASPVLPAPVRTGGGLLGSYQGYIARGDGTVVPLAVGIQSRQSSGGSASQLRANLRVGLFGGVSVGTDNVIFDFTTNLFTASFASGTGPSLELIGHVQDGAFLDGVLVGPHSGKQSVVLSRGIPSFFDDRREFTYKLKFPGQPGSVTLSLSSLLQALASNDLSDLPLIPHLSGSFYSGYSPTNPDSIFYDPLVGRLDITLAGNGLVRFEGVGLASATEKEKASPALKGTVLEGSIPFGTVTAAPIMAKLLTTPPKNFSGYYYGVDKKQKIPVVATLDYEEQDAKNPVGAIFPTFPLLYLKLHACAPEGVDAGETDLETISVNPVTAVAVFRYSSAAAGGSTASGNIGDRRIIDFEATFSADWSTLSGPYKTVYSGASTKEGSHLYLHAVPGAARCKVN